MRQWLLGWCVAALLLSPAAQADVTFSHDNGVAALPPPPANSIFALPDVGDAFFTPVFVRSAPGPNLGNLLLADQATVFGLLPGDNIDAFHIELRERWDPDADGDSTGLFPAFTFSADRGATGLPGTGLAAQAPANAHDLYETNGGGLNTLTLNENQVGIGPNPASDLDAVLLTMFSSLTGTERLYFSLTPGSPSLAVIGAGPADVLAVRAFGTPVVSIRAAQLGLLDSDDIDALTILDGIDGNDDGDFDDTDDHRPFVMFSVSPTSRGLANTAVRTQRLSDPPVGGDIFFAGLSGFNTLMRDDAILGLADDDNLDALDLPEMSLPGITPFTGGFTTPGGGGGGGGGGGVRISVCASGEPVIWKGSLFVRVSCNGGAVTRVPPSIMGVPQPVCFEIECDNANHTLQNIIAALQGLNHNGVPVFSPAAIATRLSGSHFTATIPVSAAFAGAGCTLVNVSISFCPCITINTAILGTVEIPTSPDTATADRSEARIENPVVTAQFHGGASDGEFFFHLDQDGGGLPLYLPYNASESPAEAMAQISDQLNDRGYASSVEGDVLSIHADPTGTPIKDYWAIGVFGDPLITEMTVGMTVDGPCRADIDGDGMVTVGDLLRIVDAMMGGRVSEPYDVDGDGVLTLADVILVATALELGCDAI